ncbi:MAG TPA: endo-1,4-beta-xylanase [Rhizomicrobium sp.]|jgi:endo-1,4-beta-xylanase|nr:endo-1,4-beta-xylanase [Rhizomicrobium sp.]
MKISRRDFVAQLGIASALPNAAFAQADDSLRARAQRRGILYGCATGNYQLRQPDFASACAREAGIIVPEYELKRHIVEPVRGHYDFSAADALLAFANAHGMRFRGHPLVWHKSNPPWLADAVATRDEKLLAQYIQAVVGHYKGRVHSWDVVNEAIWPQDGRADNLRRTLWLDTFGPSYIDAAFHAAHDADPNAMLVYNDWGCEGGETWNDAFRAATLSFLESALKRRVPIDALGLQGHLGAFKPIDQKKLRKFLEAVKTMGLRILITEHDVDDHGGPSDIDARDRAVADASRRFLDVACEAGVIAILTWGLSDRYIQAPYEHDTWGWNARMLPLDAQMQRKPMRQAIADTLGD